MSSILRKAMLPVAVAVAMAAFIGAFGSTAKPALANEFDICYAQVIDKDEGAIDPGIDTQLEDNDTYILEWGKTYGLILWVEDAGIDLVDGYGVNVGLLIDSETGSGKFTSQMEIVDTEGPIDENDDVDSFPNFYDPNLAHLLYESANSIVVDIVEPYDFNDADGQPLDSIADWLEDVGYNSDGVEQGYTECDSGDFIGNIDDDFTCNETTGDDACEEVDGWGFVDFECNEYGLFYIDIGAPFGWSSSQDLSIKFLCPAPVESAEIKASPTSVETSPASGNVDTSTITVTVKDADGARIDGAKVTLSTDNCKFNAGTSSTGPTSPAGGGTTVVIWSDTDTGSDTNFVADNPLETQAGTAEGYLNCSAGAPGVAHVTAIVDRPGSDIVLKVDVTVVGPTDVAGLTLVLNPDDLECGETIVATATAVDSKGQAVSDGTKIYFTTDTSSGIVGGSEGAQGGISTDDGEASVLIATDPSNPGTHTVIAYAKKGYGTSTDDIVAQTSATYVCDAAVAPAAPTVAPPATGTGTGSITPPNTGDAGLASGSTSASLFVIVGAVAFVLAGLASVRFARN